MSLTISTQKFQSMLKEHGAVSITYAPVLEGQQPGTLFFQLNKNSIIFMVMVFNHEVYHYCHIDDTKGIESSFILNEAISIAPCAPIVDLGYQIPSKQEEETPIMKQFRQLKAKHPEALLLFRCGDFYEAYEQDAKDAAHILGITLTYRNGYSKDAGAMAGFPHFALDTYLPKLIRAGKRVAICDQLEDPRLTKKLVKRGITELVTPYK